MCLGENLVGMTRVILGAASWACRWWMTSSPMPLPSGRLQWPPSAHPYTYSFTPVGEDADRPRRAGSAPYLNMDMRLGEGGGTALAMHSGGHVQRGERSRRSKCVLPDSAPSSLMVKRISSPAMERYRRVWASRGQVRGRR